MLIPLGMGEWCIPFWVTLTLTLTSGLILGFSCLEHISYITANFPQMCLMLDQFLWGHSSCDCDISCSEGVTVSRQGFGSLGLNNHGKPCYRDTKHDSGNKKTRNKDPCSTYKLEKQKQRANDNRTTMLDRQQTHSR